MHAPLSTYGDKTRQRTGATIVYQNCLGQEIAPAVHLDRRRRSLSAVTGRHGPNRAYIVSVHRRGEMLKPEDHTVRLRKQWKETLIGPNDVVLITTVPKGGAGGQSQGKQIGMALAMIALVVVSTMVAGPAAGGMMSLLSGGLFTTASAGTIAFVQAGLVIGGSALLSLAAKPNANATDDQRPLYGVQGGGNLPRPGDRIPRLYGQAWTTPDLTQADYTVYDGEDQVLYKRVTVSLGKVRVDKIRLGTATLWTLAGGVQAPFNAAPGGGAAGEIGKDDAAGGGGSSSGGATEVEIINPGETSDLVPGSVYSSPAVGGTELPRPADNPNWAGPFATTPVGEESDRLQLDYSLPQGCINRDPDENPATAGVLFEYAPCDEDDEPTGEFITLHSETADMKTTRAQRYTRIKDIPMGRYVVRARNTQPLIEDDTNPVTWDGLRSHFKDEIVRPFATEVALKIRSGKSLGVTSFGEVEVQATAIIETWNGSAWVEAPERKAVYAYKDILQAEYGGNLNDNEVDLETIKHYATTLTENDTFDGVIRGPVSVYEAAATVLGVIRAEPARIGNTWSINRDEQKTVRKHKFTRRQIVRGSSGLAFEVDRSRGEADVIVEYNPDADSKRRRDVRVTFGAESLTPRRVGGIGISSWEHARSRAIWLAASAFYRRERYRFTAELQGRIITRGQPAAVDTWFISDARAAGVISRSNLALTLDTDVVVGVSTYATLRDRRGREWGPVLVDSASAPNVINLNSADAAAAAAASGMAYASVFANDNEDMTTVLIGPLDQQTYLIDSVQPQSKNRVSIEALLDDQGVWDALGEAPPPAPPIPSIGDEVEPAEAIIPWVHARCVQKGVSIEMEWAVGRARGTASYVVKLSYDDGATWEEVSNSVDTSGVHTLRHEQGIAVKVGAYAVSRQGLPGPTVYTTFTTFKPSINSSTVDLLVDIDALEQQIRDQIEEGVVALQKIEITRPLVLALRDSVSSVEAVRVQALQTGLVDAGTYQLIDQLGQVAMRLALQAERTESMAQELGAENHGGRWVLRGVKDVENAVNEVSIIADLNTASIELRATHIELTNGLAIVAAGLQPAVGWNWNGTVEGWTVTNGTLTAGASYVDFAATDAGAHMDSPAISVDANIYKVVRFNSVRTDGAGWGAALSWPPYAVSIPFVMPESPGTLSQLALDLSVVPEWNGTITGLRVSLEDGVTVRFSVGQIGSNALAGFLFGDLQGQITDVSVALDGMAGSLVLKADQITVDDLGVTLGQAVVAINAHDSAIIARALNVDLTAALSRLTTAELLIDALNSSISITIEQIQSPLLLDILGRAALNNALNEERTQAEHQALVARAHFFLGTKITDEGEVRATAIQQLNSRVQDSEAVAFLEQQTRATADFAEASARSLLAARHDTDIASANASIASEMIVRASADLAEASARQSVQANLDTASAALTASINSEAIARSDADSAEAAARQTVAASVVTETTNRIAAVTSEATARANADTAEAALRESVSVIANANTAAIIAEQTARANADSAEATARTQVQANVDTEVSNRTAAVASEATARANADSAEATARTQVQSNLTTETAARIADISSEATTRANADTAEAALRSQVAANLSTETTDRIAAVNSEATARANADTAEAALRTQVAADLSTETTNRTAAVNTEATARANADTAEAAARTAVSSTVDGHTSSITTLQSTTATIDGKLNARFQIVADVNGHISGIYSNNDGTTNNIILRTDNFHVVASGVAGGSGQLMFTVQNINGTNRYLLNGNAYIQKIIAGAVDAGDIIVDNLVVTGHLVANAVSNALSDVGTADVPISQNSAVLLTQTHSVNQTNGVGYKVHASASGVFRMVGGAAGTWCLAWLEIDDVVTPAIASWVAGNADVVPFSLTTSVSKTGNGSTQSSKVELVVIHTGSGTLHTNSSVTIGATTYVSGYTLYSQALKR